MAAITHSKLKLLATQHCTQRIEYLYLMLFGIDHGKIPVDLIDIYWNRHLGNA